MRDDIDKVSRNGDIDEKVNIYEVGVDLSEKLFANDSTDESVCKGSVINRITNGIGTTHPRTDAISSKVSTRPANMKAVLSWGSIVLDVSMEI